MSLILSMGVSLDGFISDRAGEFRWSQPGDEQFRHHLEEVRGLSAFLCGRRLYETMLVWETDPAMREDELGAAFADAWCGLPKIVFSRTLQRVEGNARLARGSVAEELGSLAGDVGIGGPALAATAFDLVDRLHLMRHPIIVGGGAPLLPPVAEAVALELVDTRTFASRVVLERYARVR